LDDFLDLAFTLTDQVGVVLESRQAALIPAIVEDIITATPSSVVVKIKNIFPDFVAGFHS
jgi:hypothetical protein